MDNKNAARDRNVKLTVIKSKVQEAYLNDGMPAYFGGGPQISQSSDIVDVICNMDQLYVWSCLFFIYLTFSTPSML